MTLISVGWKIMTRTHEKVGPDDRPAAKGLDAFWANCSHGEVEGALRKLEGKWKLTIIFCLFRQPVMRYSELGRMMPRISEKMLSQQLRQLERDGLVERIIHPTVPPQVEYELTDQGRALRPALAAIRDWAQASLQHI
jgi:DNA-binding HxlR family transcriptional regulator